MQHPTLEEVTRWLTHLAEHPETQQHTLSHEAHQNGKNAATHWASLKASGKPGVLQDDPTLIRI